MMGYACYAPHIRKPSTKLSENAVHYRAVESPCLPCLLFHNSQARRAVGAQGHCGSGGDGSVSGCGPGRQAGRQAQEDLGQTRAGGPRTQTTQTHTHPMTS